MPLPKLTERQTQTYDCIVDFIRKHGYSPSTRDIGDAMGIASPNGIRLHLDALVRAGLIDYEPKLARSIRLIAPAVCPHCGARRSKEDGQS